MAKFNASRVKILISSVAINGLEEVELNIDGEPIDVTTKDSNSWSEFLAGLKNWTMSGSGIVDFAAVEGIDEMLDDIIGGVTGSIKFGTSVSGDTELSGSGLYTNVAISAPKEDKCTFSFNLQGSGALVKATTP